MEKLDALIKMIKLFVVIFVIYGFASLVRDVINLL
jgi:hypothetical protein